MYEREGGESHQDYKNAFEEFEHGDQLEHSPLAAVGIWLGTGLAHVWLAMTQGRVSRVGASLQDFPARASLSEVVAGHPFKAGSHDSRRSSGPDIFFYYVTGEDLPTRTSVEPHMA